MPPHEPDERELLRWRVHPAAARPWLGAVVALAVLALSGASWAYGGSLPLGVLALLLLSGSLWPFFMPTTYRFTTWGVEQKRWPTLRRVPWAAFRRYQVDRRGVFLSPFPHPSRLDAFRGLYLMTPPGLELESLLREYVRSP